jgi:hypothetical protein
MADTALCDIAMHPIHNRRTMMKEGNEGNERSSRALTFMYGIGIVRRWCCSIFTRVHGTLPHYYATTLQGCGCGCGCDCVVAHAELRLEKYGATNLVDTKPTTMHRISSPTPTSSIPQSKSGSFIWNTSMYGGDQLQSINQSINPNPIQSNRFGNILGFSPQRLGLIDGSP